MLKTLYHFLTEKLARAERDLYERSRALGDKPVKAPLGVVFSHLGSGIAYIGYGFALFIVKFLILIVKSPVDGYQLMVEPATLPISYIEYKELHKKTRRFSMATSGAFLAAVVIVSLVVNLLIPAALPSLGATYTFSQTNWSGGATANNATHPTNQSAWNQYVSKSAEISAVNSGADLEIASTAASVTHTSGASFTGGTFTTATTTNSDTSIELTKAAHINEYTIGALSNIAVTVSAVATSTNGTWEVSFSGSPNIARIFKNDKFIDAGSKAWKILSASDSADKIAVVDSEGNRTTPTTGAGTVGRWYASISAWEAGREGNLITRNAIERGLPYYDGSADTTAVQINGWTTDTTHYIEIYVPFSERHRGKWDTGKYRLSVNSYFGAVLNYEADVRVSGLQIETTTIGGTDPNSGWYQSTGTNAGGIIVLENNIIRSTGTTTSASNSGIYWAPDTPTTGVWDVRIVNNIIHNFYYGLYAHNASASSGEKHVVYNNTIIGGTKGVIGIDASAYGASDTGRYYNNIIQGFSGNHWSLASSYVTYVTGNNITGDATSPDTAYRNRTVSFLDSVSSDYHIAFNDTAAKDAGTDLSADGSYAFNTDIDGDTRSGTWDIGADDVGAVLVMTHSIGTSSRDFSTLQAWESARDDGSLVTRKVFKISSQSAAFTEFETVTGSVSGATGQYMKERQTPSTSETYMSLAAVAGTFQAGETLTGGSSASTATLSSILTTTGVVERGEVYNDSVFTAGVVIAGATTDATHYMWLTAEPGSRHDGTYTNKGARIEPSFTNTLGVIEGQNNYMRVEWLSVKVTFDDWHGLVLTGSNAIGSNMILYAPSVVLGTNNGFSGSNNSELRNSVIYGAGWDIGVSGGSGVTVRNTTVHGVGTIGFNNGTLVRNTIAVGSAPGFGTMDASSTNNISSDATAPGTGSLTNQILSSIKFVSTTAGFEDFHIMNGSVTKDAGTNLSSIFTDDVDSQTRSGTWDIGADEWQASSPVYNTTGTFESPTVDMGSLANPTTVAWNLEPQLTNTDVQFAVAGKTADSSWQASDFIELNREAYPSGVTVHVSYIRPAGDCTGYSPCYNSLSAWEVAQNRDLVTSNEIEIAQIGGSWTSPDTTSIIINGWTTNATHYIKVYTMPEARHGGVWNSAKYRLVANAGTGIIRTYESDLILDGLQIENTRTGSDPDGITALNPVSNVTIKNNIVRYTGATVGTGGGIVLADMGNGTNYAFNNIVYDFPDNGIYVRGPSSSARGIMYNNTSANNGGYGYRGRTGYSVLKNNIAYGNTLGAFLNDGIDTVNSGYNAIDSATGSGGSNDRTSQTFTFVDAVNNDFRLASSDAGARNYGTNLSADPFFSFNTDVQGHLRADGSWDIGAHEYGATGGNIPASLNGSRYVRYKAYFSTQDAAFTSQVSDATVAYSSYATTGPSLTSSAYNTVDATNILGKIAWTATTPSGTEMRFQVRSAPNSGGVPGTWSSWCGETACDDADYFASTDNNVEVSSGHPLRNGGNDQWLQYKAIFVSTGAATPTLGDVTTTYVVNAPPDFDASYGTNGVSVAQNTSDGQVVINYRLRDTDTSSGTTNPGFITPSFAYSIDGGSNWVNISSGYLGASDLTNKAVQGVSYTTYAATWNAKGQTNGTYNASMLVRVTATDNEGANNSASATSGSFALDVKNPAATVTVNGTASGQSGAVSITSSDDSSYQMMASNNSDFSADGLNGTSGQWVAAASSLTWTFASSEPVRVYIKFRDSYQNETSVSPDAPNTPTTVTIQDTSNLTLSEFREFVSWSVNGAGDFGSYKAYRSTDGSSYSLLSTINSVNTNFLTDGASGSWLSNGTTYYYKLTAQDASGNVSRYSSVVSDIPDGQGGTDVTPPTITSVAVSGISTSQATVTWTTDELSDSTVYYSTNLSYGSSAVSASMVTSHTVVLTGLTPNTTYNIRTRSVDPLSNSAQVDAASPGSNSVPNFSFTTSQGAVISSVSAITVSGNSATIVWNTNQDSDSYVVYSVNADLSGSQTTGSATLVGGAGPTYEHRVALTGLSTNVRYYYKVQSTNASSNLAENTNGGQYYTFTTVNDVTAPVISNVGASLASQTSAAIAWITNELADSQVLYGSDQSNLTLQTTVNATMTINHSVVISNLTAGSTYYYRVVSADPQANSTTSSVYNFSTTAQDFIAVTRYVETTSVFLDKSAPLITAITVGDITDASVAVSWETDEDTSSFVEYGRTEAFGTTVGKYENTRRHKVVIAGLLPDTLYYFKAKSHDPSGNLAESARAQFTTASRSTLVDAVAKKAQEAKDVAQLTQEVEQLLSDLAGKVSPPQISGVEPKVSVTSSFAEIAWVTDRKSNSTIAYASEKDYLPSSSEPYTMFSGNANEDVLEHKVVLSNLLPGTLYHFQVRSKGVVGGVGVSRDMTFKTKDDAVISGLQIRDITKDTATVAWKTNIPTTTRIEYGLSVDYTLSQADNSLNTNHVLKLKSLQAATFYHFRAGGSDQQGSQFYSPDLTFTTESPPSLLDVKIDAVKEREMTIRWFTNVLSDSTIEYTNIATGKTESVNDKQLVKNHGVSVTGLAQDTQYTFKVISRDEKGSEVTSSSYNLQTLKDIEQPFITNIQNQSAVSGKDRVQTIISWKTSEPASTRVYYQEGVVANREIERATQLDSELTLNHTVVFTNFKPGTAYRLRIESIDASGNTAASRDFTILTPQQRETVLDLLIKNFQDIFKWTEKVL